MAFKMVRDDGARWIPEAGGYVKDGVLVSKTPEYTNTSSDKKQKSDKTTNATIASTTKTEKKDSSSKNTTTSGYYGGFGGTEGILKSSGTPTVDAISGAAPSEPSVEDRVSSHIDYFGSKEAYADAIRRKLESGEPLTDEAAAKAFMESNPELFTGTSEKTTKTTTSGYYGGFGGTEGILKSSGTPTVDAISGAAPSEPSVTSEKTTKTTTGTASTGSKTPSGGTSSADRDLLATRRYFENLGYVVEYDPESENIRIYDPATGYSSMILKGAYTEEDGRSYITEDVAKQVLDTLKSGKYVYTGSKAATYEQQPASATVDEGGYTDTYYSDIMRDYERWFEGAQERLDEAYALQDKYLRDYMDQINKQIEQYGDTAIAMLNAYQQQYAQALEQLQDLMNPDTTVPESVKVAVEILKNRVNENVEQLREEMNRRGIYQSGLAMEMERRLREGGLTEEQKLYADWIDEQHRRAYNAAIRYAQALQQYASGYAGMYRTAYLEPVEQRMAALSNLYQAQADLAKQRYADESSLYRDILGLTTNLRMWKAKREEALKKAEEEAIRKAQEWEQQLLKDLFEQQYKQEQLDLARKRLEETIRYHNMLANRPTGGSLSFEDMAALLNFIYNLVSKSKSGNSD